MKNGYSVNDEESLCEMTMANNFPTIDESNFSLPFIQYDLLLHVIDTELLEI